MPPRMQQRRPSRASGNDPTVNIANAAAARYTTNTEIATSEPPNQEQKANDDLKKLIETLKNKLGNNSATPTQKTAPPPPKTRSVWDRSISKDKNWAPKPAYTLLTRISNHEKVPTKSTKAGDLTINALPHSFLYRPGIDGIKIDKIDVKAGKQIGIG